VPQRTLFAAVLVITLCRLTPAAAPAEPASQPATEKRDLREALYAFNKEYSLYFTIERDDVGDTKDVSGKPKYSTLDSRPLLLPTTFKGVDALLKALADALPDADIVRDKAAPEVIHIRERSLEKRPEYIGLARTDIRFTGKLGGFLTQLKKQSGGLIKEGSFGNLQAIAVGPNYDLPIDLDLKNVPYVEVFTRAMPRWNDFILWECDVVQEKGQLVTYFKPGRAVKPASQPSATEPAPAAQPARRPELPGPASPPAK
jgi:hypothetical protein